MPGETVDASIVFLPRNTTLVGGTAFLFTTLPLDVSQYSGVQFQVWRGPVDAGTFTLFLEESLDGQTWVPGATPAAGFDFTAESTKFFSYSFRLRWFRLAIATTGTVTCWAEGLLRGGGSGAWPSATPAGGAFATAGQPGGAIDGLMAPPAFTGAGPFGMAPPSQDTIQGAGQLDALGAQVSAAIAKAKSG